MNHGFDLVLREDAVEHSGIADVALVKLHRRMERATVPRLKIVDDDDIFPLFDELMNRVGADVAGTAANQNCHNIFPFLHYKYPIA